MDLENDPKACICVTVVLVFVGTYLINICKKIPVNIFLDNHFSDSEKYR